MIGKEYKVCVSGIAAKLTEEVKQLLAQGWEVCNGNGHNGSASQTFCQAMVRGNGVLVPEAKLMVSSQSGTATAAVLAPDLSRPPVPEPAVVPPWQPKPIRTRTPVTVRGIATFLGSLIGVYLLLELLIFHSGYYARFLEPEGATGTVEYSFQQEVNRPDKGRKTVLVLGNSRMAEGFSAKLANEASQNDGYLFVNGGIPGASNRVWYYFLRDLDPQRNRYKAITLPLDTYDDTDDTEDYADRTGDLWMVVNRLRFSDIVPFTFSFPSWKSRLEVFRGALLKGIVYQRDLQDFIEHPTQRKFRVATYRASWAGWAYNYAGIESSLAGMSVDWANKKATYPPGILEARRRDLDEKLFHYNARQTGKTRAYEVRWLGALVDMYKGSQTRIIVFQAPRSPAPNPVPLAHFSWHGVDELAKRPWVTVLDRHKFEWLEKPELFADHVHLNSEGRAQFSPVLAATAKEVLENGGKH